MGMILHFETADAAAGLVKRYMSAIAPGSYLIVTVASGKGARAEEFYQTYNASGFAAMYNHTPADFASFFGDLEIVPPDWATRGGSVPAGASSRRRPSDPTG
jgi:S-adenosyl methyltransferase